MTLTVLSHITLDGVVQAPARQDEDSRDGFVHGGWSVPYGDEVMMTAWGRGMAKAINGGALLLGRRTYSDFAEVWPKRAENPMSRALSATPKYVASTSLDDLLQWENSTLLMNPVDQVMELKREMDLVVLGSGTLIQSLASAGLIDEYLLTVHPVVLGQGRKLFQTGFPDTSLTLTSAIPTSTGVIVTTYQTKPAEDHR
jgi:dihydrofolate reductase